MNEMAMDLNRVELWDAINDYVKACGGDPGKHVYGNLTRMDAVAAVERAVVARFTEIMALRDEVNRLRHVFRDLSERATVLLHGSLQDLEAGLRMMQSVLRPEAERPSENGSSFRGDAGMLEKKIGEQRELIEASTCFDFGYFKAVRPTKNHFWRVWDRANFDVSILPEDSMLTREQAIERARTMHLKMVAVEKRARKE